jgi:antitoxin MazE
MGGGFVLEIPDTVAQQTGFTENAEIDVTLENGVLVARPVAKPRYTLEELLRNVTDDQFHPETDTGPAVGREEW